MWASVGTHPWRVIHHEAVATTEAWGHTAPSGARTLETKVTSQNPYASLTNHEVPRYGTLFGDLDEGYPLVDRIEGNLPHPGPGPMKGIPMKAEIHQRVAQRVTDDDLTGESRIVEGAHGATDEILMLKPEAAERIVGEVWESYRP